MRAHGISVGVTYDNQGNQDGEEPQHMHNQHDDFDSRQKSTQDGVDEHSHKHGCPKDQRSMPPLWDVVGVIQLHYGFDLSPADVTASSQDSHPTANDQPCCDGQPRSLRGLQWKDWIPMM